MKLRYFIAIWVAVAAFCLTLGFSTKASFTALSPEQDEVLNSYYHYTDYYPISNDTYDKLSGMSQLIVTCRFNGKRKLENMSALSEVRVENVIKGNKKLKGKTLRVYEPIDTQTESIIYFRDDKNYAKYVSTFHWQGKSSVVISRPDAGDYLSYYAPMSEDTTYLLFLNPKQNPPQMKQAGDTKYVMADSSFAKIAVNSVNAKTYNKPPQYISYKQAMQYEILMTDVFKISTYFDTKAQILNQLNLV